MARLTAKQATEEGLTAAEEEEISTARTRLDAIAHHFTKAMEERGRLQERLDTLMAKQATEEGLTEGEVEEMSTIEGEIDALAHHSTKAAEERGRLQERLEALMAKQATEEGLTEGEVEEMSTIEGEIDALANPSTKAAEEREKEEARKYGSLKFRSLEDVLSAATSLGNFFNHKTYKKDPTRCTTACLCKFKKSQLTETVGRLRHWLSDDVVKAAEDMTDFDTLLEMAGKWLIAQKALKDDMDKFKGEGQGQGQGQGEGGGEGEPETQGEPEAQGDDRSQSKDVGAVVEVRMNSRIYWITFVSQIKFIQTF